VLPEQNAVTDITAGLKDTRPTLNLVREKLPSMQPHTQPGKE
jgi:hypothetical protein